MGIESTLNCIETTLYRINWIPFEMADEELGYNWWFLFQQCVYMASNAKKKYKSCLNISKKHLGRGNFVLFANLFPSFRDHRVVSKLKSKFMLLSTCKLIYILILFPFSFIPVQIECEILPQQFFITDRFPLSLDTEPKKCYWWNLKS